MLKVIHDPIDYLLLHCGSLRRGEKLLILYDATTEQLARKIDRQAGEIVSGVCILEVPRLQRHGQELDERIEKEMLEVDLIIAICQFSLAHTRARLCAARKGIRFLSLPMVDDVLLQSLAMNCDFRAQEPYVVRVANIFTQGSLIYIRTNNGTDIKMSIEGRKGNCCPGFVDHRYLLGSPPDIEANVSPIEDSSKGVVVVDGSITTPEIGLLQEDVILYIECGKVIEIKSNNIKYVEIINRMFGEKMSKRRVLAECGIGLNPKANLTGAMLTDEGAIGCVHFGFGSNYTIGGQNKVDFHLDFVFRKAELNVDATTILSRGQLSI